MDAIEEYFQGEYISEKNKINEIDELVNDVIKSLIDKNLEIEKGWPYEISATPIKKSDNYSFSTNAMILFVLAKFIEKIEINSPLLPNIEWEPTESLKEQIHKFNIPQYYKIFNEESKKLSTGFSDPENNKQIVSKSGSFGYNDPFTFSWIAELLSKTYIEKNNPFKDIESNFIKESSKIIKYVFSNKFEGSILNFSTSIEKPKEPKEESQPKEPKESQRKASNHIFPLLRVIHLYKSRCNIVTKIEKKIEENQKEKQEVIQKIKQEVNQKELLAAQKTGSPQGKIPLKNPEVSEQEKRLKELNERLKELKKIFKELNERLNKLKKSLGRLNTTYVFTNLQNRINQQISHFTIQNSLFDTAELVMSLEGMLLLDENRRIDENLIRKVFEILETNQKNNLNWRPLKPFVTSPQGDVLLPLSIEIANSLLRICKLLERKKQYFFHEYASIFNKYTQWLLANVSQCTVDTTTYKGWRSEHVQEANVIHPWETAQVLIYLMTYKSMIQERVAHKSLKKSGLTVYDKYVKKDAYVNPELWTKVFDTDIELGYENSYKDILNKFIIQRELKDGDPSFSMLLFGPPGTGKSTMAEQLADSLNWRLITITPSDFISHGEADIEGRAKSIFKTLEEQKNCVILFDEIDRLILDRDSSYYLQQGDFYQFMTPSMLVKFKDLRTKEKSIFIVATNYAERIDSAIKRSGRIDEKYLINTLNLKQREKLIRKTLDKVKEANTAKTVKTDFTDEEVEKIAKELCFFSYVELKSFLNSIIETCKGPNINYDEFYKILSSKIGTEQPTIKLSNYKRRFQKDIKVTFNLFGRNQEEIDSIIYPYKEFLALVYLKIESGIKIDKTEQEIINRIKRIPGFNIKKHFSENTVVYNTINNLFLD